MKKSILKPAIILITLFTIFLLSRGRFRNEYIKIAGFTQGTSYHITYEDRHRINLKPEIDSLLADFDQSLSTYIPSSIISRVNLNEPDVKVDKLFTTVFDKAYEVYQNTSGAFDITIAPIANVWGFGFTEKADVDSAMIDSLLQYIGMNKVRLKNSKVVKTCPQVMLNVNAIAQGYSVDIISTYLEKKGIHNYLVEIGGEIKAKGKNPTNKWWRVGVDKPVDNNLLPGASLQSVLQLKNCALATSGNYRKFYEKDGTKYVHSINPKTGYPVISNLLSVTVKANDCMTADAYATAFMVMGLEKTKEFLAKYNELQAYLIYSDEQGNYLVYTTEDMKIDIIE